MSKFLPRLAALLHARGLESTHAEAIHGLVCRVALLEPLLRRSPVLPFPVPMRTLDTLRLASLDHLRGQAQPVELAAYDRWIISATRAMNFPVCELAA